MAAQAGRGGRGVSAAVRGPTRALRGFTIVELLVVVAIISVLVAIVVPSLGGVLFLARMAVCHSNLGQLNRGLELYAADHDHKYWMFTHAGGHYWYDKIAPYHDYAADLRFCPEAPKATSWLGGWGAAREAWGPREGRFGSYGLNLWLTPNDPGTMAQTSPYYGQFLPYQDYFWGSPILTEALTPTFCDANWVGSWPFTNDLVPEDLQVGLRRHTVSEAGEFMGRFCIDRHRFSVCSGFADGSAKRVRLPELWELQWSRGYVPIEVEIPEP